MERPTSRRRRPQPVQLIAANTAEPRFHTHKPRVFAGYCIHNVGNAKVTQCLVVILILILVVVTLRLVGKVQIRNFYPIQESVNISDKVLLSSSLLSPGPELHPENYIFRLPSTIQLNWTVTSGYHRPDGVRKRIYLINGSFPGPTIEARSGDRLVVTATNGLKDEGISIHWHGLHMRGIVGPLCPYSGFGVLYMNVSCARASSLIAVNYISRCKCDGWDIRGNSMPCPSWRLFRL